MDRSYGSGDRRRVLLTGAAGRIGTSFRSEVGDRYALRLVDRRIGNLEDTGGHEVLALDLADLDACRRACAGRFQLSDRGVDESAHLILGEFGESSHRLHTNGRFGN